MKRSKLDVIVEPLVTHWQGDGKTYFTNADWILGRKAKQQIKDLYKHLAYKTLITPSKEVQSLFREIDKL